MGQNNEEQMGKFRRPPNLCLQLMQPSQNILKTRFFPICFKTTPINCEYMTNSDIQGKTFASLPQTTPSSWAQLRALDKPPGSELTGSNRNSKSENKNNLNKVNIPLNGENLVVFDGFRMATTMSISDVHSVLLVDCIVQVLQSPTSRCASVLKKL